MTRKYAYVGPQSLAHLADAETVRVHVDGFDAVKQWVAATGQIPDRTGCIFATYVVDMNGRLWIADRQSEHVACARGDRVLAAGEVLFNLKAEYVEYISNQSTGYCPEPESWVAVADALRNANIESPDDYTAEFLFRRCTQCETVNIVKDGNFTCAVCNAILPEQWNCDDSQ